MGYTHLASPCATTPPLMGMRQLVLLPTLLICITRPRLVLVVVILCTLLLIIVDKLLHLHAVAGHRDGVLLADVPVLQDVVVDLGGGGDRRDV